MQNTIVIVIFVLLLLLYNYAHLTIGDSSRLYSVDRCNQELRKGRQFLQQFKKKFIVDELERREKLIQTLLMEKNSLAMIKIVKNKTHSSVCPLTANSNSFYYKSKITNKYLHNVNEISSNNDAYYMDLLLNWINKMHVFLSDEGGACDGPEFHNITTITATQLTSFISLFLVNHGLPLCSICNRMLKKIEQNIFSINFTKLIYTDQIFYQLLLVYMPDVKTICSGLIPACYHYYGTNELSISAAGKCSQCTICMATTTFIQNRILLDQTIINKIDQINGRYLHAICLQASKLFPSTFFWTKIKYVHCMKWTNNFFHDLMNRLTTNLMPEKFCSETLHWCRAYEIPSIIDCLKEFCDESLPEQWQSTVCNLIPN